MRNSLLVSIFHRCCIPQTVTCPQCFYRRQQLFSRVFLGVSCDKFRISVGLPAHRLLNRIAKQYSYYLLKPHYLHYSQWRPQHMHISSSSCFFSYQGFRKMFWNYCCFGLKSSKHKNISCMMRSPTCPILVTATIELYFRHIKKKKSIFQSSLHDIQIIQKLHKIMSFLITIFCIFAFIILRLSISSMCRKLLCIFIH